MARRDEDTAASSAAKKAQDIVEMNEEDEEAIRAKLRQSGWDKKKLLKLKEAESAASDKKTTDAKDKHGDDAEKKTPTKDKDGKDKDSSSKRGTSGRDDKDRERERDRDDKDKDRRSGRGSRRSRSARRRDKDRDRDRGSRRDRARGSRRNRSRSASKSRSRSRSTSVRRRDKDHGRDRERSSRADKRRSRSRSASASRSRSVSKSRVSKRSRTDDKKSEKPLTEEVKDNKKHDETKPKDGEENPAAETNGEKKTEDKPKDKEKEKDDRKSRRSSRHRSRSASRSPSRSSRHRHRRHRSPSRSRSASRSRRDRDRGRGGSRSRSRSHRRRSSRRRHSRSRSRSRSSYSRRRRSKSNDRGRRNANSSPSPGQHPPTAAAPVAPGVPSIVNPVNPTITQLMQQYPTMSLQDIIAKMQASNLTMAAAVSMKPARELYVGNLPPSITGPQLQEFLGTIIQQVGLTVQPGNPILSTWISTDGHFAFCEMRSIEECNMALMLNQLPLLGQPLKFGRPKSFMGPPQPMPTLSARTQTALTNLGCTPNPVWFATPSISDLSSVASMTASLTSAIPGFAATAAQLGVAPFAAPLAAPAPVVAATNGVPSNKLVMSNIPAVLADDQVKELVQPFGELKSFQLIVVPGQATGSALFEYEDESVTDDAVKGLDGLELGPDPLVVRRAAASEEETGPVLKMANMVSIDELNDDEEFADLKDDVEEECKRFGSVVALEIPRPNNGQDVPGLGSIFVQFETTGQAAAALKALSGRKFGGNIVKVSYFPIAKFQQKDFV